MSEYYQPTQNRDRLSEDELLRLQSELIQPTINSSLDDATTILTGGFVDYEKPLYEASLEQLEKQEAAEQAENWTRRGLGAIALIETADLSELITKQNSAAALNERQVSLGYQNHHGLTA
jgi:hypothetical protein